MGAAGADTDLVTKRRLLLVIAVGVTGSLLSACTVESGAVAGVGVDAEGRPVGYVQLCRGTIDSMTLWAGTGDNVTAEWTAKAPIGSGGFTAFSFTDPGPDWSAGSPTYSSLDPAKSYTLQGNGGDHDAEWSTQYVDFTTKTLASLRPGQVRYWVGTNDSSTKDSFKVSTVEEFKVTACKPVTGSG